MARGVNKVILIGNLGADPEVRYLPSGDPVANIRIATDESYKDKNTGQLVPRTEWHSVVFFGKLADIVKQYLHKGSKVYVEGKLRTRKWQGQDGQDRYSTEVVVDMNGTMQMLDGRPEGGTAQFDDPPPARSSSRGAPSGQSRQSQEGPPDFDDDIPF